MKDMWLVIIGIIAVILVVMLFAVLRRPRRSRENVINFPKGNNTKQKLQKCTYCKNPNKLTFYASDNGTVVGVCKACKSKATAQDMLPL